MFEVQTSRLAAFPLEGGAELRRALTITSRVSGIVEHANPVEPDRLDHERLVQPPKCKPGHYTKTSLEMTALVRTLKVVQCHHAVCGG